MLFITGLTGLLSLCVLIMVYSSEMLILFVIGIYVGVCLLLSYICGLYVVFVFGMNPWDLHLVPLFDSSV